MDTHRNPEVTPPMVPKVPPRPGHDPLETPKSPDVMQPMSPHVPPTSEGQENPRYAHHDDVHRMPPPMVSRDDTPGPVPMTYTTPHQLRQMLDEALAKLNRDPDGIVELQREVQELQRKLADPGLNPSPADMHTLHEQVTDVAERARMIDVQRATPAVVTREQIDARFDAALSTAKLLKQGREAALADIESLENRARGLVEPTSQADLDMLNLAILTVLTRIENQLSKQG